MDNGGIGALDIERAAITAAREIFALHRSAANIRLYHRLGYLIVATEPVNDRVSAVIMAKQAQPVRNGIGG